ncbi:Transposable element P transposase [Amphibalanus amphitrite]|uniref:Transposable element P transposase n=1 Tax=Amphibalanus amphitrite TaxID=1232801 RepID=A0A6A4VP08_AMPAM|nr:Transposable element P transposase [Amphibalanus amphitrite]
MMRDAALKLEQRKAELEAKEAELEAKEAHLTRRKNALKTHHRRLQQTTSRAKQRAKRLREQNKVLRTRNAVLKASSSHASALAEAGPLTAAQRRALVSGKRVRWSDKDVGTALGLRILSRRAYIYVKECMRIPLPSFTTLSEWTRDFRMTPGLMEPALAVLEATVTDLSDMDKLCVLAFDDVSLDGRVCYDQARDVILEASKMQLVMVRGLTAAWKQPIAYDFDTNMAPNTLNDIIFRLEKIGLKVMAAVSDMASPNESLWTKLGITSAFGDGPLRTWFSNPVDPLRYVLVIII